MKKIVMMAGVAVAMMSMASCCGEKSCDKGSCAASGGCDKVYTGVIPAADVLGIRYTLGLDYDDNGQKGDYTLVETYIDGDSASTLGYKDVASFASEGDFTVGQKDGKTFLRLTKDAKDSSAQAADVLYFLVSSDSTVTLSNDALDNFSTPGMNYTLKLAK